MLTIFKVVLDFGILLTAALFVFPKLANVVLRFTGYYTPRSRVRSQREKLISIGLTMATLAVITAVSTWTVMKSDSFIDKYRTGMTTNSNAKTR